VLGARSTAWNGSLWYFSVSLELILWLKVRQKAGIYILKFQNFSGGDI